MDAEPELIVNAPEEERHAEQRDDEDARRDWSPLEVLHLAGFGVRQRGSRGVEPGETADAADDKVSEQRHVPAASQP